MTQPLIVGPPSWPGMEYTGIPLSGRRRDCQWHRPPSGTGQTQTARKLAFETKQRSQKVGSQYHRHETPETRKWELLVGDSPWGNVGDGYTGEIGLHCVAAASRTVPLCDHTILEQMISSSGEL